MQVYNALNPNLMSLEQADMADTEDARSCKSISSQLINWVSSLDASRSLRMKNGIRLIVEIALQRSSPKPSRERNMHLYPQNACLAPVLITDNLLRIFIIDWPTRDELHQRLWNKLVQQFFSFWPLKSGRALSLIRAEDINVISHWRAIYRQSRVPAWIPLNFSPSDEASLCLIVRTLSFYCITLCRTRKGTRINASSTSVYIQC